MFKPTQVKMSDCEFYVNEEKRTVVCVLPNTELMARNFIFNNHYHNYSYDYYTNSKFKMPSCIRGSAKCSPGDEWDPEFGKVVAFKKMKWKLLREWFKVVEGFFKNQDNFLDKIMDEANTASERAMNEYQLLNKRIIDHFTEKPE